MARPIILHTRLAHTDETDAIIRAGYRHLVPVVEIAAMLGCTTRAVYQRAFKLGLADRETARRRPATPNQRESGRRLNKRATLYWREYMAWCPPDRRDEYRKFRRKVGATEARRIIEADLRRAAA